jgi:hypothetical protein
MSRVLKLLALLVIVWLDVAVVSPWLGSVGGTSPGVERAFWSLAIPLISSLVGAFAGKKKGAQDPNADMGGETDGGGFNWGAAAPYLAGAGGLAAGMLMNKKKKPATAGSAALDELLAFQKARMMQAEPLNQASLAMASGMLPTYMKQPGSAVDTWQTGHANANQQAAQAVPRKPLYS